MELKKTLGLVGLTCCVGIAATAIPVVRRSAISTVCQSDKDERPLYASVEEVENRVKVFIGDVGRAPEGYVEQRAAYIKDAADSNADSLMEAVIGLDDYYAVEAVISLVESYDVVVNRAYMWPKGETGRMALYVENGDIPASLKAYKRQTEEEGYCSDPGFAADYQRFLDGEYGVFAITVTATASALEALDTEADCISYVDVMYNPDVEAYAESVGKAVSYIELPAKPDGAS